MSRDFLCQDLHVCNESCTRGANSVCYLEDLSPTLALHKVPVGYTTDAEGNTEIVDYTDVSQQFKTALRDQKTKIDLTKSQKSTYGDLGGTVKEETTTPASGQTKEDKWANKELK